MSILEQRIDRFVIAKLDIEDVIYRGEGNASLVVAFKSLNKVLRMNKSPHKKHDSDHEIDLNKVNSELLNELAFTCNVMNRLFKPSIWISQYSLISLSKQQMIEIKNKIENLRPESRKAKKLPVIDYYGLLTDDHASFQTEQLQVIQNEFPKFKRSGPMYCVEIKPKQGFISEELADLGVCKFRLKQQEKLKLGLIDNVSTYCPLDLFSGDERRMRVALNGLINSPQNNFRLFVDKAYIELEEQTNLNELLKEANLNREKLVEFLVHALNHPFDSVKNNQIENLSTEKFTCKYHYDVHKLNSGKKLSSNSILKSVLDVQMLDEIGSNNANQLYLNLKNNHKSVFEEWKNELQTSTELVDLFEERSNELDQIKNKLTKFLYSLTAKDCSILITFQRVLNIPAHVKSTIKMSNCEDDKFHSSRLCFYRTNDSIYLFTLAIIDIGRKSLKRVKTKCLSDQTIIEEFLRSDH